MRKPHHFPLLLLATLLSISLISCDNNYDLSKELNTDITIGSGFIIPVGKTEKILLSRIIETSDNLTVNNEGIYEISALGDFNSSVKEIDPVDAMGFDPILEDIIIDIKTEGTSNRTRANEYIFQESFENISNYDVNEKLPKEVESVSYAELSSNNVSPVSTKMTILAHGIPEGVETIYLKNLTIEFPEIFILEGNKGQTVVFDELTINKSKPSVEITLPIAGISISDNLQSKYIKTIGGEKHLVIDSEFKVKSDILVPVDLTKFNSGAITLRFSYVAPNITITKVGGTLVPDVKISEFLKLNDIPDFIKGEGSKFNPSDVSLNLELNNPINMSLATSLLITPWNEKTNIASGKPVTVALNDIKPNMLNKFIISNEPKSVPGYVNILAPDLTTLLNTIPDSYRIESDKIIADSKTDNEYIQLGKSYNITGDYNIDVPFKFTNLAINYTDSIDNLLSDLKDISDKTNKIIVSASGVSTIPTELVLSVKVLDGNDKELNGIDVNLSKFKLSPSINGQESVSDVEIILTEKEGSHDLELLNKILYTVKATSLSGQSDIVLRPDQYIIIKKIVAKIPEGIDVKL